MATANEVRAGQAYVEVRADTSKVAEDVDKGVMDQLKHGLGGRSEFKEAFELLKGGGAVVGLSLAAEAIKGLAEGGAKFRDALMDADKNAADMAQEALRAAPVFSQIEAAGSAINELFTGQEGALKRANDEAKRLDDAMKQHVDTVRATGSSYATLDGIIRQIRGRGDVIGLKDPALGVVHAIQSSAGELGNVLSSSSAEREKYAGPPRLLPDGSANPSSEGSKIDDLHNQLMKKYGELAEANHRVAEVDAKERENVHVVGAQTIRDDAARISQEAQALRTQLADARKAVGGIDQRQTAGVLAAFRNLGRDLFDILGREFKSWTERVRKDIKDQNDADEKQRQEASGYDYRDQQATADIQLDELGRQRERESGQSEIENNIANERESIRESVMRPDEKYEEEKNYLQSLNLGPETLRRALDQARNQIFGGVSTASQFGGMGAELVAGGGVQERIAKATEDTAKGVRRIASAPGATFK